MREGMKRVVARVVLVAFFSLTLFSCGGGGGGGATPGGNTGGSTADTAAPTVPTGLVAAAPNSDSIALSWTVSTDDVGVTGYKIYRGGTEISTSATNSIRDSGLTASTSYSYTVKAFDAAGNISAASNTASATTLASGSTGGEQVAPDMSSVPVSMTYNERMAALATVAVFWKANTTTDLDADNFALANYINTQPAFADAGVSPDRTVWGRFKDGQPVVWLTERRVGITAAPALSPGTSAPRAASASAPRPLSGEIPQGSKAVMIDMDGLGKAGPSIVNDWLNKPGTGYKSVLLGGSLVELETEIKDVAVLYFSTHGVFGTGQNGRSTYLLATSSEITSFVQAREQMAQDGYLVRVEIENKVHPYWFITESFVDNNWTFTPDSLIVIDSCSLFDQSTDARKAVGARFRSTLAGKSDNNTTVVGWDNVVGAIFASGAVRLFFDRVLGANKSQFEFQPEIPPQRPFTYKEVYDWMVASGKVTDPFSTKMKLEERGTTFGQLAPSIQSLQTQNRQGKSSLVLIGKFGPDTGVGTVTVGNKITPIMSWSDDWIEAQLPSMTGSYGDVVVEVRGHKSNAVPLTLWTGTATQVRTNSFWPALGSRAEFSCPVRFIGDVHFYRPTPGVDPWGAPNMQVEVPAPCTYKYSGEWDSTNCHYVLSGSGTHQPFLGYTSGAIFMASFSGGPGGLPFMMFPLPGDFIAVLKPEAFQTQPGFPLATETWTCTDGGGGTGHPNIQWSINDLYQVGRAGGRVILGADYNLTGTFNCIPGDSHFPSETCTETWDVNPLFITTPTNETQR